MQPLDYAALTGSAGGSLGHIRSIMRPPLRVNRILTTNRFVRAEDSASAEMTALSRSALATA